MPLTRMFVNHKDIKEGECANPSRCAVALSIKRRIKPGYYVSVTPRSIKIIEKFNFEHPLVNHRCSDKLTEFIMDFDASAITNVKGHLKPIQFTIDIPTFMLNKRYVYKKGKNNGNSKIVRNSTT